MKPNFDYDEYYANQTVKYHSLESLNPQWSEPQQKAIQNLFSGFNRNISILDAGCGDGWGLNQLLKMGFRNLYGLELNSTKAQFAVDVGHYIRVGDLHEPYMYHKWGFDVIYCSHALEHCYSPSAVITNFLNALNKNGKIIIIVPYPDDGPDDAHCGKFELGTYVNDELQLTLAFFSSFGLKPVTIEMGYRGGPEVQLVLELRGKNE